MDNIFSTAGLFSFFFVLVAATAAALLGIRAGEKQGQERQEQDQQLENVAANARVVMNALIIARPPTPAEYQKYVDIAFDLGSKMNERQVWLGGSHERGTR